MIVIRYSTKNRYMIEQDRGFVTNYPVSKHPPTIQRNSPYKISMIYVHSPRMRDAPKLPAPATLGLGQPQLMLMCLYPYFTASFVASRIIVTSLPPCVYVCVVEIEMSLLV